MDSKEIIADYINHPERLLRKKPFTRGFDGVNDLYRDGGYATVGETVTASLPDHARIIVSQSQFLAEYDPASHKVLFDDNIPAITVKTDDGIYREIEFIKMSVPFQKMLVKKHVEHLCGYPVQHTLSNTAPTESQKEDFAEFKRKWKSRNMDGMRTKMVTTQKSTGDAGLLFYFDRYGHVKCRLISYDDGYVICSHNDENGDRLLESIYYRDGNVECIDTYTDTMHYHHEKDLESVENNGWVLKSGTAHGFNEIPLVTKRGDVAWNDVQDIIEVYETLYNIFIVIQKRHGWGILYIKGTFSDTAKKIAGSVILNDTSLNKDGSAQFLTPPSPQGTLDTLKLMEETIQKGAGATFIMPKDVSTAGDISGVAIQITQSLDNEEALLGVIEWQNVAAKMSRLFKYGLSKEKVSLNGDSDAITRYSSLDIMSCFRVWRPRNDTEYNQMLAMLKNAALISQKTGIEKNTESTPDEELRVSEEAAVAEATKVEETIIENNLNA